MKKSSYFALLMGTISTVLFALGMCMVLIEEWDAFSLGIVFGCIGLLLGFITLIIWRKIEHKQPIHYSAKSIFTAAVGIIGALIFVLGMCYCMMWNRMVIGMIIGFIGMMILFALIPLIKGFKD